MDLPNDDLGKSTGRKTKRRGQPIKKDTANWRIDTKLSQSLSSISRESPHPIACVPDPRSLGHRLSSYQSAVYSSTLSTCF